MTAQDAGSLAARLAAALREHPDEVLSHWLASTVGEVLGPDARLDATELLDALARALADGGTLQASSPEFAAVRQLTADMSARRGRAGMAPASTASFVLSLREALVGTLDGAGGAAAGEVREVGRLVDALALLTFDSFVAGREEVIQRQGQQLLELSTPVVRLWDRVVAAPLVGTLDSARAQVVMESLLQAIVDEGAVVAILDITGVPTVDTLVAQHLLKTVSATRLMGADCIVSGIRPQTAQTIVELGIDLAEVMTRASLADALATAIDRVAAHDARLRKG